MKRFVGKVAIVTGVSAGIGKAIAIKLVKEGMIVVGLARRTDKLNELTENLQNEKGRFHAIPADITQEDDILKAFNYVTQNLGPIHVLINNAGVGRIAPLICGKTEQWKQILDTNVLGLCIATREAVQNMIFNKIDGHIIHINSLSGHPISNQSTSMFGASKHAVTSLTKSLRNELNTIKAKIKVTSISPGYVDTEMLDVASETSKGLFPKEHLDLFKQINPVLQPEDIAECVMYVLSTPPHVQVQEVIIRPVSDIN